MTDRELLELAAKASCFQNYTLSGATIFVETGAFRGASGYYWNPLTDDGDALRLAVKLSQMEGGVTLCLNSRLNSTDFAQCYTSEKVVAPTEYMLDDPYAATRRAIVRAAAEIGRNMK